MQFFETKKTEQKKIYKEVRLCFAKSSYIS